MTKSKRKTILITGGAGFVGSNLCRKYLNEGHEVICLDNLQKSGSTANIDEFRENPYFKFIKHDIIKPIKFKEKIDWVMNFACPVSCVDLQVDPIHTLKSNVHGVINMLEVARQHKAVFIQASSSDIYGVREKGEAVTEETMGRLDPLTARACYEEGKRVAETLCMDYHRKYEVDVKIVRIFNTYGPGVYYRDGRVMSNFIVAALNNQDITIYGDGSFTRSHLYVDDLVDGVDRLMKKPFGYTGPVNIGSTNEITIKELADAVIKLTGSNSRIKYDRELTGDPKFRRPNISRAEKELHWSPRVSLEEGIKKTIEHYRQIEFPEKKIIIFTTTYYPDVGPAELAIMELTKSLPDAEFYIITVKSRKKLPDYEEQDNTRIFRLGSGNVLGKYLFPLRGALRARRLMKNYDFRFVWSAMASYGGLAAVFLKLFDRKINFLLTFDKTEAKKKGFVRRVLYKPIYQLIFKQADYVYLTDKEAESKALAVSGRQCTAVIKRDEALAAQVKDTYTKLLNKQEKKLDRPL